MGHARLIPELGPINDLSTTNDPLSVARALNAMSVGGTEAQMQAQREARTLEYKSAVNKAHLARKKPTTDSESDLRCRDSMSAGMLPKSANDALVFPQSQIATNVPSPYPMNSGMGPAQPNLERLLAVLAATYGNLMPPGAPNTKGQVQNPQMKIPISNSMLPPWGAPGPFSASGQAPQFMQQPSPFPVANSPKLQNQRYYHDSILETLMEACHQQVCFSKY